MGTPALIKRKISVSLSSDLTRKNYKFFKTVEITYLIQLSNIIMKYVWSPIVWRNGERLRKNFISCDYLVLDFDSGATALEIRDWCRKLDLAYFIGATKSHGIAKDEKPPCDRFRLVIPAKGSAESHFQLTQNIAYLKSLLPIDSQCKDGARYFYPCREVLFSGPGKQWSWRPYRPPSEKAIEYKRSFSSARLLSNYAKRLINKPITHGERNCTFFKIGAEFTRCGYSEADIIALADDVEYELSGDFSKEERNECIRNGIKDEEEQREIRARGINGGAGRSQGAR